MKPITMKPEITFRKEIPRQEMPPPLADMLLIVDDVAADFDILLKAIGDEYVVSIAPDGATALKMIEEFPPDLILLDVVMPEMDGYEVCEKLKANPDTRDIPVIFLTAVTGDDNEEKGLSLGAVDYIAKPYKYALVKARVRNHLALRRSQMELMRQRNQVADAYQKLRHLEKQRDDLVHMIVHDMRSPLTNISCFLDLLSAGEVNDPEYQKNLGSTREAAINLRDMVSDLLDISRMEADQMPLHRRSCDLAQSVHAAVERLSLLAQESQISVHLPAGRIFAYCDPDVTVRIIQNLFGNAIKFTPASGSIRIELAAEDRYARISIADTGCGIPPEYHEKVFEKFGQVEDRKNSHRPSTGLGLTFCKMAAEAQGGGIQLESEPGHGATFHVRLPLAAPHPEPKKEAIEPSFHMAANSNYSRL